MTLATACPKPEKRGRKPRRPIARGRIDPLRAYRKLEKLCDDTFALIVRIRGGNRCKLCGSDWKTQCAHLIGRSYRQCRWSFLNAWCLCSRCHDRWTHNPLGWDALVAKIVGEVEWEQRKLAAQIRTKPDLSVIRFAMKRLLIEEVHTSGFQRLNEQVGRIYERHSAFEEKRDHAVREEGGRDSARRIDGTHRVEDGEAAHRRPRRVGAQPAPTDGEASGRP